MKFKNIVCSHAILNTLFNKTALFMAVENEKIEIIKLLLKHGKIDVNIQSISTQVFFE